MESNLDNLKVGDKISGGRIDKHYAEIEKIEQEFITIRYCGEVKSVKIKRELIKELL